MTANTTDPQNQLVACGPCTGRAGAASGYVKIDWLLNPMF